MFSGIVQAVSKKVKFEEKDYGYKLSVTVPSNFTKKLKKGDSVAVNGVCLTVVSCDEKFYTVTAIKETLDKTNLGQLKVGDLVNIERAMKFGDRLDGHIVQGHVDQTAKCISINTLDGSWNYTFKYNKNSNNITIEKGSITVNGVSLTVVNSKENEFSVAIIPYTYENTNFKIIEVGQTVNLEFDMIGKYITKLYLKR